MASQYDEMQGEAMDVKDHPDRVMPRLEDMVNRGRSMADRAVEELNRKQIAIRKKGSTGQVEND